MKRMLTIAMVIVMAGAIGCADVSDGEEGGFSSSGSSPSDGGAEPSAPYGGGMAERIALTIESMEPSEALPGQIVRLVGEELDAQSDSVMAGRWRRTPTARTDNVPASTVSHAQGCDREGALCFTVPWGAPPGPMAVVVVRGDLISNTVLLTVIGSGRTADDDAVRDDDDEGDADDVANDDEGSVDEEADPMAVDATGILAFLETQRNFQLDNDIYTQQYVSITLPEGATPLQLFFRSSFRGVHFFREPWYGLTYLDGSPIPRNAQDRAYELYALMIESSEAARMPYQELVDANEEMGSCGVSEEHQTYDQNACWSIAPGDMTRIPTILIRDRYRPDDAYRVTLIFEDADGVRKITSVEVPRDLSGYEISPEGQVPPRTW